MSKDVGSAWGDNIQKGTDPTLKFLDAKSNKHYPFTVNGNHLD